MSVLDFCVTAEKEPFFSVIIPVYNGEATILEALNSVFSQTYSSYEVIVIDDCSTDNTLSVLKDYQKKHPITIIENPFNIGAADSRNKGISISHSDWIAFLDADDIWHNTKLEKQKEYVEKTKCDICYSSYLLQKDSLYKTYTVPETIHYNDLLQENCVGLSTTVIKKTWLDAFPMSSKFYHEDYALWLNLTRNHAIFAGIQEPLMTYNITKNSRSYGKVRSSLRRLEVYVKQEKLGFYRTLKSFAMYSILGVKKYS